MKKSGLFLFSFLIFIPAFFGSCISLPFDFSESSSWALGEIQESKGTVKIISVSAEKSGGWDSLEKETACLLPLLLSEEGYSTVPASEPADYSAEAVIREREYADGWKTKRSLSAELRFWKEGSSGEPLPLSAGRALMQGKQSFSSSKTLNSLLEKAVKSAVRGLEKNKELSGGEK